MSIPRHLHAAHGIRCARRRHVHPVHLHAHVDHRAPGRLAQIRNVSDHPLARGQRPARKPRPVHGLGHDRVCPPLGRRHDHIEGLGHRDLQFVHRDWLDVLSVRLHDRHREARNTQVEVTQRRGVDEPESHALPRGEQARPAVLRTLAVHQVGVEVPGDVGDVGGRHAHPAPHQAVLHGGTESVPGHVAKEIADRGSPIVRVVALFLEPRQHDVGALEHPVGEDDDVLTIVGDGIGAAGVDDQRAVVPELFLQPGMAVIPVRAALRDRITIDEGLAGRNAGKGHAGHAVHLERQ